MIFMVLRSFEQPQITYGSPEFMKDKILADKDYGQTNSKLACPYLDYGFSRLSIAVWEIEAVKVHDFVPCGHKILHELFRTVLAGIDF